MSINEHATASTSVAPIAAALLRWHCDPQSLHFQSTDELDPIDNLIGQDRALDAIRFGSAIDRPGYNIFALGPQGTGRHAAVLSYLGLQAQNQAAPDDWIYVHNFASIHKPRAIRLPPGTAVRLRDEMEELVADLRNAVPARNRRLFRRSAGRPAPIRESRPRRRAPAAWPARRSCRWIPSFTRGGLQSAPTTLLILHCCATDKREFVSQ